jgi:hypothetical protein
MLIHEMFDNPYALDSSTQTALTIKKQILSMNHNMRSLRVFEVVEHPEEFIMTFYAEDGIYEVHHLKAVNGIIQTGTILSASKNRNFAANPRYISTAINLYQNELKRGHAVRVVADKTSGMWPTYQRVINQKIKKDGYESDNIDTNYKGVDNGDYIAQVIRPRGKFKETFQNFRLSI